MPEADKEGKRYYEEIPQKGELFFLKGSNELDWGMKNRLARIFNPKDGHTVMLAIGDALGAHVQAAFSRQDELVGQVQAIRDDTELDESERVEAIEAFLSANLNTGWPGQV